MSKHVTRSLHICSGGHTELTKTSFRDQATLTLTRLAVKKNRSAPTDVQPTPNSCPAGVHRLRTKPWRAQKVEGQCFRKHPESSPQGTGIFCPEKLREPAKIFSRCLSSSFSVRGLPANPRTRHPGNSSRSR